MVRRSSYLLRRAQSGGAKCDRLSPPTIADRHDDFDFDAGTSLPPLRHREFTPGVIKHEDCRLYALNAEGA